VALAAVCCDEGLSCCDGQCVNTKTSPNHCGECNGACSPGKICDNGACDCRDGLTLCGDVCWDTTRDENNCGGCNQQCTGLGMQCCDSDCVDTHTDPEHCGLCTTACPTDRPACCRGHCYDPKVWICCPEPMRVACPINTVCCTGVSGTHGCCPP
jgi:hypothetical protein